jgi:hypothetical protein
MDFLLFSSKFIVEENACSSDNFHCLPWLQQFDIIRILYSFNLHMSAPLSYQNRKNCPLGSPANSQGPEEPSPWYPWYPRGTHSKMAAYIY